MVLPYRTPGRRTGVLSEVRCFVLARMGRMLSNGEFFFSTRGIYDSFQTAVFVAQDLWKLDERTMREWATDVMFTISLHRIMKANPRVTPANRQAALQKWYWVPTKEAVFFPMGDLLGMQDD